MLRMCGIDPQDVALIRHSGKGKLGFTPYDLWNRQDDSFDRYQSTQAQDKPLFSAPFWASFVSTPLNETLFVGLYAATKGDRSEIDWLCPMTGLPPGEDKGRSSDLYYLTPLDIFDTYRGVLKIEWDKGYIAWARHAATSEFAVVGKNVDSPATGIDLSREGDLVWSLQRTVERDPRLVRAVISRNLTLNGGKCVCEACQFQHADSGMFDVHHSNPLLAGPRLSRSTDLIVLCPLCHRRAHRSGDRFRPYSLAELRLWNESNRP